MFEIKQSRVRWTEEEEQLIASRIVKLQMHDPCASLWYLANNAQSELVKEGILDSDRIRVVNGAAQVERFLPYIRNIYTNIAEKSVQTESFEKLLEESKSKAQILAELTSQEKESLFKEEILNSLTAREIVDAFPHRDKLLDFFSVEYLSAYIIKRQQIQINNQREEIQHLQKILLDHDVKVVKPQIKKPKICVVGNIGAQFPKLEKEFKDRFELILVTLDGNLRNLPSNIGGMIVLGNHTANEQRIILRQHMKKLNKEDRIHIVNGVNQASVKLNKFRIT